jgi:hypothetical protein
MRGITVTESQIQMPESVQAKKLLEIVTNVLDLKMAIEEYIFTPEQLL